MTAAVVHRCRRCYREIENARTVFCSDLCLSMSDADAARLGAQLAALHRDYDPRAAAVEQEIAQFAFERCRILAGQKQDIDHIADQLAPLKGHLEAARAAGEVRIALDSDLWPSV